MKAVPFTFDSAFDGGASEAAARQSAQAAALHAEEISVAKSVAYAEGYEQGRAAALADIEAATQASLQRLTENMSVIFSDLDRVCNTLAHQATDLTLLIAKSIAGFAINRSVYANIDTLIEQILEQHAMAPRLVIRVADALLDGAKTRIEALAATYGFQGRIIYLSDPELQPGDCLIEWADGGIESRINDREQEVNSRIKTYLANLSQANSQFAHGMEASQEGTQNEHA